MNPIKMIDERISRKLAGMRQAFRGVVTLVRAAGAVQFVQGEGIKGEKVQGAEMFQHYGYTSNPPAGTMCVVLPMGGKTGHGIVIATEHGTYRLKNLQPGEVALYSDEGDSVILKRGRVMEVTTQTLTVNCATATVNCTGKATIKAAGGIDADGAGDGAVKGCVQGDCMCAFTGMPHPHVSGSVKASA
jgi:phage baseplate assembly protein V